MNRRDELAFGHVDVHEPTVNDGHVETALRRVEEDPLELEQGHVADLVDIVRVEQSVADVSVHLDLVAGGKTRAWGGGGRRAARHAGREDTVSGREDQAPCTSVMPNDDSTEANLGDAALSP